MTVLPGETLVTTDGVGVDVVELDAELLADDEPALSEPI